MAQVIQTNGELILKTRSPGNEVSVNSDIILDPSPGNIVKITGTLIVEGETISVEAEDLTIEDNFIIINSGETGHGVTLGVAGLQVDRGTAQPSNIIWDEATDAWTIAFGNEGDYNYNNGLFIINAIHTNSGINDGDLNLIGSGDGVINVAGTTNYASNVTDDNDIPNKKYVDSRIVDSPGHNISADNSYVYITDKDIDPGEPGSISEFHDTTNLYTEDDKSAVSIIVDGVLSGQFYDNKAVIKNLEIKNDEGHAAVLTNKNEGNNLYFKTTSTGKLQTNYALQLEQHLSIPSGVDNSTLIYADSPGEGRTGLYFVTDTEPSNAISYANDELISRKRALVYSMIF